MREPMSITHSVPVSVPEKHLGRVTEDLDRKALHELGYAWAKEHAEKFIEYIYYDSVSEVTRAYTFKIREEDPLSNSHKLIETRTKWVLK